MSCAGNLDMQLSRHFAEDLLVPERNSFLNMSSRLAYRYRVRQYPVWSFTSLRATKIPCRSQARLSLRSSNTFREYGFGRRWLLRCAIAGLAGVCFAVSASALDPTRAVSQYLHDSWGTERGWPGGSITAIAQTSDGYLWIGTDKGLVRFDGLNFHQFKLAHPDPIWIGPVRTLVVDASDNLWILLQNTLVFRYQNGNFELIRGETENGTTAMARGTSGAFLLSSAEGTFTYSDNRFRSLSSAALLTDAARVANGEAPDQRATPFSWFDRLAAPTLVAISMAQTDDGKIWLGTEHQGLFYLQEGHVSSASNGRVYTK